MFQYVALLIIVIIFILFKCFLLPIQIAERKNLTNNELKTIKILTWLGLISSGLTWIIALCMAIFYNESNNNFHD